jgi:hypothetical protein
MTKKETLGLGLAGLIGAAVGLLMALSTKKGDENKPPRSAPQLPIQNPGDQSEFPTAPEGERDLG